MSACQRGSAAVALLGMSAFRCKETSPLRHVCFAVAIGGKADMLFCTAYMSAFDPKRTSAGDRIIDIQPRSIAHQGMLKATHYRHSDRKGSTSGYSNDPHHGTPCACVDGGFCRDVGAGHVPWRKQQSVADQSNKEATARAALAARAKEDAHTFTDPCARFQGRGGARSLETGHHRPFPDPQDLSDLSVVGRSWAEVAGGRPSDSRGVL
jgi:hypothetical protein